MARDDRTMPLLGHFEELRGRLLKSLLCGRRCLRSGLRGCDETVYPVLWPLHQLPEAPLIVGLGPTEAFFTKLKVAFIAALFLRVLRFLSILAVRRARPLPT